MAAPREVKRTSGGVQKAGGNGRRGRRTRRARARRGRLLDSVQAMGQGQGGGFPIDAPELGFEAKALWQGRLLDSVQAVGQGQGGGFPTDAPELGFEAKNLWQGRLLDSVQAVAQGQAGAMHPWHTAPECMRRGHAPLSFEASGKVMK